MKSNGNSFNVICECVKCKTFTSKNLIKISVNLWCKYSYVFNDCLLLLLLVVFLWMEFFVCKCRRTSHIDHSERKKEEMLSTKLCLLISMRPLQEYRNNCYRNWIMNMDNCYCIISMAQRLSIRQNVIHHIACCMPTWKGI